MNLMPRINANIFVGGPATITANGVDIPPRLAEDASFRVVLMLDESALFMSQASAEQIVAELLPHLPTVDAPDGDVPADSIITSSGKVYAVDGGAR